MLANDRRAAAGVADDLQEMGEQCQEAGDRDSAAFLQVLQVQMGHRDGRAG